MRDVHTVHLIVRREAGCGPGEQADQAQVPGSGAALGGLPWGPVTAGAARLLPEGRGPARTLPARGGALRKFAVPATLTGSPHPWWLPAQEGCPQDASEVSASNGWPAHPGHRLPQSRLSRYVGDRDAGLSSMVICLCLCGEGGGRHLCSFQTDLGSRYKSFRVSSPLFASCKK